MSKIEVDEITQQSGSTLTVGGGACKTATVDATTVTLGRSGGTVSLASGATQSGFGRTGTVDWDTTPKTATFSAVSGDGFFCNTTSSAFTCNLPAGAAGAIVSLADYAATWNTNNLTVSPNGTDKIGGVNADVALNTQGQSVTFVYVDSTQGWINTMDSTSNVRGTSFITATGGTITTSGDFKIHTFTGPGTFTVTNAGSGAAPSSVDYLVVAGGASGANAEDGNNNHGGGGGAGGYRESSGAASGCYTVSPLGSGVSALPVSVQGYPITVGAGGAAKANDGGLGHGCGNSGSNSSFSTITSTGGGFGGRQAVGGNGGSGGGGAGGQPGGAGNTPPVSPPQGQPGGTGVVEAAGGGGGATQVGQQGCGTSGPAGPGGNGATSSINATPTTRAGGGGGGGNNGQPGGGSGGSGGGGAGGAFPLGAGTAGTANTGGGGGATSSGQGDAGSSGAGGSGIVIIRYKFQ